MGSPFFTVNMGKRIEEEVSEVLSSNSEVSDKTQVLFASNELFINSEVSHETQILYLSNSEISDETQVLPNNSEIFEELSSNSQVSQVLSEVSDETQVLFSNSKVSEVLSNEPILPIYIRNHKTKISSDQPGIMMSNAPLGYLYYPSYEELPKELPISWVEKEREQDRDDIMAFYKENLSKLYRCGRFHVNIFDDDEMEEFLEDQEAYEVFIQQAVTWTVLPLYRELPYYQGMKVSMVDKLVKESVNKEEKFLASQSVVEDKEEGTQEEEDKKEGTQEEEDKKEGTQEEEHEKKHRVVEWTLWDGDICLNRVVFEGDRVVS